MINKTNSMHKRIIGTFIIPEPIYLDIIEFVPCPIETPNVEINNTGADAPTANAASILIVLTQNISAIL